MTVTYEFHPKMLSDRWSLVAAAASKEKFAQQHILVELYEHGIRLVATDLYVLATAWVPLQGESEGVSAPWVDDEPDAWFTITAHDKLLDVLLTTIDTISLTLNPNDRSVTFSGPNWDLTLPTGQENIGQWRDLFVETAERYESIAVGVPMFKYFARIAPLLHTEVNVVMRWYNRGKITPMEFEIPEHALRGLAMPVNLP